MLPSRGRVAATAVVLLAVLTAVPAAGSDWRGDLNAARQRIAAARGVVASPSVAGAVRAAAQTGSITAVAVPAPALAPVAGVPAPISQAVGHLSAAISGASAVLPRAVLDMDADPSAIEHRLAQRRDAAMARGDLSATAGVADAAAGEDLVDMPLLAGAAETVATAIDAALPSLRAYAATRPATNPAAGCDVVDQPGLCIGGTGANTYTRDDALVIDLGGDDVHLHSAGSADATKNLPVAITIDVGGNDRYSSAIPTATGFEAVQGAGRRGIGALIDVAGNDSYDATGGAPAVDANGQGYGSAGVGLLADFGGNDSYRMRKTDGAGMYRAAHAQGYGAAGLGIHLDASGNDTHEVSAHFTPRVDENGIISTLTPFVQGLGFGSLGGVALVVDGGGADSFLLSADHDPIAPGAALQLGSPAAASAEGLGYGDFGGAAAVLTGPGATIWTARATVTAPSTRGADVDAFGVGKTGAVGVLSDAGGNDVYVTEAMSTAEAHASVASPCTGCPTLDVTSDSGPAAVAGFGYGAGGIGLLQDVAGDDQYRTVAITTAQATGRDDRTAATPQVSAVTGLVNVTVQGSGVGGAGALHDLGGNDVYSATGNADARSDSMGTAGALPSFATTGRTLVLSQAGGSGGGYGELHDLGGIDRYAATTATTARGIPQGFPEPATASVQGSVEAIGISGAAVPGAAMFRDIDGGAADVFSAAPADPACNGTTRGVGVWHDCGPGAGIGING